MTFSVLIFILIATIGVSVTAFNNREMMDNMMYIPYDCKHNNNYARFFTHMLVHADWMHLGFNMFALYFLGKILLDVPCGVYQNIDCGFMQTYGKGLGQVHFLALYVLGGMFATLIPYIRHHDNPHYRSLGASGAVSAVIFGAILWNPGMPLKVLFLPSMPAFIFGPLYLLIEYFADKRGGTGIAHDAHIGGALFGLVYVLIINIDKGKEFIHYFF
ncbi:MAG: rhomboid family intramembrane serine protease [Crocinitomicaceae bacterium]|nr:rhomboid family intramembrane serine protease [Crocinitomicaceae bacterium]